MRKSAEPVNETKEDMFDDEVETLESLKDVHVLQRRSGVPNVLRPATINEDTDRSSMFANEKSGRGSPLAIED